MKTPFERQLELFSAALDRPKGDERLAFLQQACAGEEELLDCLDRAHQSR